MQAITTKYLGPTITRGARMKALCAAGSIVIAYDYHCDIDANHKAAAVLLVNKLGWDTEYYGRMHSGCLVTGDYCHVIEE